MTDIKTLSPHHWPHYELIDTGGYEKLERFGKYTLRRPEPQAVWRKALPEKEWEKQVDAYFKREKGKQAAEGNEKGQWMQNPNMPGQWYIPYTYKDMHIQFRLGLTAFKHIGLFPEQAANWNYIYDQISSRTTQSKVLNLFAYTGGASLAAKAAGADVTHVDSVKPVLNWANENMKTSHLDHIRWVLEDALKFVKREAKRGNSYSGIILDPPAYGRGPDGEKWILEEHIAELMESVAQLLDPQDAFCILNLYSMGFSSLIAENLINNYFPGPKTTEYGELYIEDKAHRRLPLSVFGRFNR